MGPRSCERGNCGRMGGGAQSASRFNGAALVRARKSRAQETERKYHTLLQWGRARASAEIRRTPVTPRSTLPCFNGAALVRARKWADTLTHASLNRILLQWGRARASAEIGRLPVYPGQSPLASMGPRSCERGNDVKNEIAKLEKESLQWGRARASAEISVIARPLDGLPSRGFNGAALVRARKYVARSFSVCVHFACFNGAALVRARKFGRERCGYSIVVCASMGPRSCERGNDADQELVRRYCEQLQWGRARASAEIATFVSVAFPRHLASMGPRSCERGNGHCAWPPQPCAGLLQWGRARASAEMGGRRTTSTKPPGSLQWGRARASAEIGSSSCQFSLRNTLQWGRARASAEIQKAIHKIPVTHASMGPRSCERGNNLTTAPSGGNLFVLQWGRARASAEMEREQWRAREIARLLQWGRARASAEI